MTYELFAKRGNSMLPMKERFKTKHQAEVFAKEKGIETFRIQRVSDDEKPTKPAPIKEESMKTGGMVKHTKSHLLHKGELVVPATVVKHLEKLLKKK